MWKRIQKDPRILRRLIALDVVFGFVLLVDGLLDGRPLWLWIGAVSFASSLVILAFYVRQQMRVHNH